MCRKTRALALLLETGFCHPRRRKKPSERDFNWLLSFSRLRGPRGPGSEAVREVRGRVEHRRHLLHPAVRLPALLRRERREPLRADPQRFVLYAIYRIFSLFWPGYIGHRGYCISHLKAFWTRGKQYQQ